MYVDTCTGMVNLGTLNLFYTILYFSLICEIFTLRFGMILHTVVFYVLKKLHLFGINLWSC